MSDDPLPPLPTRIRFDARLRDAPRGRTDVSLVLFVGCILLIFGLGIQGIASITTFLDLTRRSLALRAKATPRPEPTPEVEIRFQ